MSFGRALDDSGFSSTAPGRRALMAYEERRRAVRTTRLGIGTLACPYCDAPVAIGEQALAPDAGLTCPFCAHSGALREFVSLAAPARPARVVVRVALTS